MHRRDLILGLTPPGYDLSPPSGAGKAGRGGQQGRHQRATSPTVTFRHPTPAQRANGLAGKARSKSLATSRRKSSRSWSGAGGAASLTCQIASRKKNPDRLAGLFAAPASYLVRVRRRHDRRVTGGPASRSERAPTMDATRARRTRDRARQSWYARHRQWRFARFLGFVDAANDVCRAALCSLRLTAVP